MKLTTKDGRSPKRQSNGKFCASKRVGKNWDASREQFFDTEDLLIRAIIADPTLSVRMEAPKDNYGRGNSFVASNLLIDGKPVKKA